MEQDLELEAIQGHYERMGLRPRKHKSEKDMLFDKLFREYGDEIHKVLMPKLTPAGMVFTENEVLAKDAKKMDPVPYKVKEIDYMGYTAAVPKKERNHAIGMIYLENLTTKGDINLADEIAKHFGVSRITVFRASKLLQSLRPKDAVISGDWVLKDIAKEYGVVPWRNPDDYGSRKGTFLRNHEARSVALRKL